MSKNIDIKLGYSCNNDCIHCVITEQKNNMIKSGKKIDRSTDEIIKEIDDCWDKDFKNITFTGGEPTIRNDFLYLLDYAKNKGFKTYLQTNARKFASVDFSTKHISKIDYFMIALHGSQKEIHDSITQKSKSFEQTILGINNILKESNANKVGIKLVISKNNMHDLLNTIKLVHSLGIKYINIAFAHINGSALINAEKIIPKYSMINKELLACINYIKNQKNIFCDFESVLPCCFKEDIDLIFFADFNRILNTYVNQLDEGLFNWENARLSSKKKIPQCSKCIYNRMCEGFWKEYIDMIGYHEFYEKQKMPIELLQNFIIKKNSFFK